MTTEEADQMRQISESIIECWMRIKAKARARGDTTNIEKHAPCLTGALNQMEGFLHDWTKNQIRQNKLDRVVKGD